MIDRSNVTTKQDMLNIPALEISSNRDLCREPVVSVLMMTRNHEAFISLAAASVLEQVCKFDYEILIGEDFSQDNTRAVCEKLQTLYPKNVRLVVADRNVGITPNFLRLAARARGKYMAFLEGDDYWIDSDKLQLQVDLLETHMEYSWCGAATRNRLVWAPVKACYGLTDILSRYIIHTSSVMFRAEHLESYPKFPDAVCWESMLFAYLTRHGNCGYLDREVSYYRRHSGGLWHASNLKERTRMSRLCIDVLKEYFSGEYDRELTDRELWIYQMDTDLAVGVGFWSRWRQALALCPIAAKRLLLHHPLGVGLLVVKILAQPISGALLLLRRKLALRSRMTWLANRFSRKSR